MIEPDFRESQLQQCVNGAFLLWVLEQQNKFAHPVVPSLPEEELLGWDTAFYFPWLIPAPHPDHHGCNFFLQYKIALVVEGRRGGQYANWHQPYYRFQLYHAKKQGTQYVADFHQLHTLQALARAQYEVYYATNQVTSRNDLFALAESRTLLDNTPFLDVADVTSDHHYVTFTPASRHFLLHSETEECRKYSSDMMQARLLKSKWRPLRKDNKLTFESVLPFLKELEGTKKFIAYYLSLVQTAKKDDVSSEIRQWIMLRAGLRRFFNIDMLRVSELK